MHNKYFDYKKFQAEEEQGSMADCYRSRFLGAHFEKVKALEESLNRIPTAGELFFLQTDLAFNAFTFIPLVAKNRPVVELFASTYSISRRAIDGLVELHDKGMVEQATILISDSMIKRNPVTVDNLMGMARNRPNLKVLFAWSHAKVCLMRTPDDHFVVEGSGNWSENAHFEQYLFANSKPLYEFRLQLFTHDQLKKY